MLQLYNFPLKNIPEKDFILSLEKSISKYLKIEPVSIIFISKKKIQELNKRYRGVDQVTDVLSFNFDTKELLGEVYICKEYIDENTQKEKRYEELVRLCIHGILHLYGYDHKERFIDRTQKDLENMYILQENILDNILKK